MNKSLKSRVEAVEKRTSERLRTVVVDPRHQSAEEIAALVAAATESDPAGIEPIVVRKDML